MMPKILLTSFQTWKPEQPSNASDDLLLAVMQRHPDAHWLHYLRQLPVDFDLAPQQVIHHLQVLQPQAVLCCGMAENRPFLSLEQQGTDRRDRNQIQKTWVNLTDLMQGLPATEISDDAGDFVCNYLYYRVLDHLHTQGTLIPCIFVHVPRLTDRNRFSTLTDFLILLQRVQALISFS